ncbi:MAG: IclR family transcriptional regulator [Pseudomonas sp.]|nr:IclR family transcriptional regulator [Pseudomonas sp.]
MDSVRPKRLKKRQTGRVGAVEAEFFNGLLAARLSGLSPSATRRFLLTLLHEGYVESDGREYWLTAKALRIGQAYVDSAQLPRMLRPIVEQVARSTGEHLSVGVRDGDDIVHIVRSRYSHVASPSIRPGSRVPMYCTASGRLWLASLSEQALADYFSRVSLRGLTPHTQVDPVVIREALQQVAEQGFALVDQEFEVGMRVIGVPLRNRAGELRATLSLTTHASRASLEELRFRYLMPLFEAQELLKPVV